MKDAKDNEGHSIKILGRAGMIYQDGKKKYFVDCEMLVGPEYDIVVYTSSVEPYTEEEDLSDDKKREIITIVAKLLMAANIRAEFQP